ncbi:SH3 domain-binding glutamic acid-rich-like protein 3 [Thalassophryne amazonica]|uniref:SH3 domain-binding glutamic acid-rich-like protein 3 n=1 Tax=Thalassophryne amazonica TaxID=390379 RepID=UPI001471189C|nr:SH3 domain-binding glutamic acid-rich-like protein 3 [Thalassophryne amazonica]
MSDDCYQKASGDTGVVILYWASVTSSLETKKNQSRIRSVLESKNIPFKCVDVTQNASDKELMRKKAGDSKALPPQLCKGNVYLGDYNAFENAVENEDLEAFLKL